MKNVITAIDKSGSYRVYLTISTDLVRDAVKVHNTSPVSSAALGRVLTGAGLMGLQLKNETDKLTVIFKGDGPIKEVLSVANSRGEVKGYASNPDVDLPLNKFGKLDVGGAFGIGELTVIKDLGLKDPYVGSIALVTGEVADDLTAYYYISEQQNTAISLGVKVDRDCSIKCAGGMFIQMLPSPDEKAIDYLEEMLKDIPPITTLIEEETKKNPEKTVEGVLESLLNRIFKDMPKEYSLKVLGKEELVWKCDCSKERLERALMTIGVHDLTEILEEDKKAELTCHFCLKKYLFKEDDLKEMLERIK